MKKFGKILLGILVLILILVDLTIGFSLLAIVNIPRFIFPFKSIKIYLSKISNALGEWTVFGVRLIMKYCHGDSLEVICDEEFDMDEWYIGMSNHLSWADIFVILVSANYRIPLTKFFMKRELWWIPFIFLANKTLNMPFVYRHSRKEIEKNPELRNKDYETTLHACKRFLRSPSTIFSYAEGTRYTEEKYKLQKPIYKNLLNPKTGGMATALSAIPNINYLVDFSIIYKTHKRDSWSFLNGDMKDTKVIIKKYKIPENLKNKNYLEDREYRVNFKNWIEKIWDEKDQIITDLKF